MEVCIDLPLPDKDVFRYGAADEILTTAASHPNQTFTNRELRRLTGYGGPSVQQALELLVTLDVLIREETKGRTEYYVNTDRIHGPRQGVAALPQSEFHKPVRAFQQRVTDEVEDVEGIVVFGSVARGEADRQSDVDVFVVTATDPPRAARQTVADIVADLETERFDGERYSFDHHVESEAAVETYDERVATILREGITLHATEAFERLRTAVLDTAKTPTEDDP